MPFHWLFFYLFIVLNLIEHFQKVHSFSLCLCLCHFIGCFRTYLLSYLIVYIECTICSNRFFISNYSFISISFVIFQVHITQLTFTCVKLTIKTSERRQLRRSDVFIVKSEHISHLLVFLLFTLNKYMLAGNAQQVFFNPFMVAPKWLDTL